MLVILYKKAQDGRLSYYTLDDRQPGLFSEHTLTLSWGRSPEGSRHKHYTFDSLVAKNKRIRQILEQKLRTYQVLYSYFKEASEVRHSAPESNTKAKLQVVRS